MSQADKTDTVMKLILAFFRLVRLQNLIFILLTQILFYYCVIPFAFKYSPVSFNAVVPQDLFWWLCAASVLIAAAGYVINDYFDLNIDQINKPEKLVVDKIIKRRWTIIWHWLLSFCGVIVSFYISWKINNWFIGLINSGCVLLLMLYSSTFKKRLFIGNFIISILTAWVIFVLFIEGLKFYSLPIPAVHDSIRRLFKLTVLYAGFAFIISLVREVAKDMEDIEGDRRYNCKTMPIVWGLNVSKMFAAVWLVVLATIVLILQFYVSLYRWYWSILYSIAFILLPLVWIIIKIYRANTKNDFHVLSNSIKLVMLTGILSMLFFKFYR